MNDLDPDPLYATTFEEMAESRKATEVTMGDLRYVVWLAWGRTKHLFGIHTCVPLEEWDLALGSMQYIGRLCWHCEARE